MLDDKLTGVKLQAIFDEANSGAEEDGIDDDADELVVRAPPPPTPTRHRPGPSAPPARGSLRDGRRPCACLACGGGSTRSSSRASR